jgi:hypothetical protein
VRLSDIGLKSSVINLRAYRRLRSFACNRLSSSSARGYKLRSTQDILKRRRSDDSSVVYRTAISAPATRSFPSQSHGKTCVRRSIKTLKSGAAAHFIAFSGMRIPNDIYFLFERFCENNKIVYFILARGFF